ncbi:Carbohydrate binding module (family 6) [Actinacidiphila yanglinensis]|uniref:Carbohydrate binding module (Family 6) n=1 Tax=Actinacidiphila yanglinensis TaxID=310779 RepID=A0A1H5Z5E3_9ACTN|nr:carbohydrate-binding protein [Actinacidiphila yanglinensis]SEG30875.1 Carbohydrate binding module (family 6) [Actinacidiphila yanglinensis]
MTAGNDGAPENDDPFAYLYRSEGGDQPDPAGGQPAPGQPGVPRTSYHQVQRVGERRPSTGGYGYPPQAPQGSQPPYGYDQGQQQYAGQYAGPTAQYPQPPYPQGQPQQSGPPGYDAPQGPPGGRRAGGGPGGAGAPNRKGLLIAAVAVVAVVGIVIAFAMTNSSGDKNKQADDKPTGATTSTSAPSQSATPSATPAPFDSKKIDASTLALAGGAATSTEHPGANAAGGTYVDNLANQGASVAWTVNVPKDGTYTFFVSYANAGPDATLTLGVNSKPRTDPVKLNNYGSATDWAKAWNMTTFNYVNLTKGANVLTMTCAPTDTNCGVNLDQVWLKEGQVKN